MVVLLRLHTGPVICTWSEGDGVSHFVLSVVVVGLMRTMRYVRSILVFGIIGKGGEFD